MYVNVINWKLKKKKQKKQKKEKKKEIWSSREKLVLRCDDDVMMKK